MWSCPRGFSPTVPPPQPIPNGPDRKTKYVFEAIQPADTLCNSGCEARLDILIKTIDLYNQSRFPIRTKRLFPNHADVCAGHLLQGFHNGCRDFHLGTIPLIHRREFDPYSALIPAWIICTFNTDFIS